MKEILLTNGGIAFVDDRDYDVIAQHNWRCQPDGKTAYAVRMSKMNGKPVCIRMHRQILGFPQQSVDHANRNGLDNQRSNLRLATNAQNQANAPRKGICFVAKRTSRNKWLVRITVNGRRLYIGYFPDAESATRAYRESEHRYFAEFAYGG